MSTPMGKLLRMRFVVSTVSSGDDRPPNVFRRLRWVGTRVGSGGAESTQSGAPRRCSLGGKHAARGAAKTLNHSILLQECGEIRHSQSTSSHAHQLLVGRPVDIARDEEMSVVSLSFSLLVKIRLSICSPLIFILFSRNQKVSSTLSFILHI